jgi:hypothetical protein
MSRPVTVAVTVAVVVASAAAGTGAWLWARPAGPRHAKISAYTHGQLTRVGPYFYCNVLDLNDCQNPETQGELLVNDRDPIQLSVPSAIGDVPWRLMQVYDDPRNTTASVFRPNARLAVTIPTVDSQRGKLRGFAVQLLTLGQDETGELHELPHAEWSVRALWR